jgi:NAD(P)-dependent dehydrogenase (short-subunit alcohol dehydrogenase family)
VLITGANSGIGRETALELARRGATVVMTARDLRKGNEAREDIVSRSGNSSVELMHLDLASLANVREFAAAFLDTHPELHVLVNNAGLTLSRRSTTVDGYETTFAVNHLGHFLLTELLLDRLIASAPSRIVILASGAHKGARRGLDFDDLQCEQRYRGFPVYCRSKLANLLHMRELAERLDGTGVTVNAVHPGWVRTNFGREGDTGFVMGTLGDFFARFLAIKPVDGARTTIRVASDPELEGVTGQYFYKERPVTPSRAAQDDAAALRLRDVSDRLVGASR